MLVFSRKKDEAFLVGDDVEVMVVEIRGDKARLAISAPRSLPVHRKEVYERIEHKTKTTLVPLPLDVAEQVEREASLAGMSQEQYLSLVVGAAMAEKHQCSTQNAVGN